MAAAGVTATAVLRDLFSGSAFARLLSRLLLIPTAAPTAAPFLGGAMLLWIQWEGVFMVLTVFGLLLVAVGLPGTLTPDRRQPARAVATVLAPVADSRRLRTGCCIWRHN